MEATIIAGIIIRIVAGIIAPGDLAARELGLLGGRAGCGSAVILAFTLDIRCNGQSVAEIDAKIVTRLAAIQDQISGEQQGTIRPRRLYRGIALIDGICDGSARNSG